jgi:hypothetical protein
MAGVLQERVQASGFLGSGRTGTASAMVSFRQGASMASDPEGIVDTLHRLARLDPVELGLEVVLDQILHAATR